MSIRCDERYWSDTVTLTCCQQGLLSSHCAAVQFSYRPKIDLAQIHRVKHINRHRKTC